MKVSPSAMGLVFPCPKPPSTKGTDRFAQFPRSVPLATTDAAEIAVIAALAVLRGNKPDRPVTASAVDLSRLAGISERHCRRIMNRWEKDPRAPVSITKVTSRRKLYSLDTGPFIALPPQALGKVSPGALVLLLGLCERLPFGERLIEFTATYDELTESLGACRKTVGPRVRELEAAELLEVRRAKTPEGYCAPNRYRVCGWRDLEPLPKSEHIYKRSKPVCSELPDISPTGEPDISPTGEPDTSPTVFKTETETPPNPHFQDSEHQRSRKVRGESKATNLIALLERRTQWATAFKRFGKPPSRAALARINEVIPESTNLRRLSEVLEHHATTELGLNPVHNPFAVLPYRIDKAISDTPSLVPHEESQHLTEEELLDQIYKKMFASPETGCEVIEQPLCHDPHPHLQKARSLLKSGDTA